MKLIFMFCSFFLISNGINGQIFEFKMHFKDAIGNVDSLIFGYDDLASDSLDSSFGETNSINVPLANQLDVRFSDILSNGTPYASYQSKKQIIKNHCPGWLQSNYGTSIELFSNHFPITVKWNHTLFNDTCRIGTLLTDVHPGGWFDTQGTFRSFFVQSDSVVLTKPLYYKKSNNQQIGIMWVSFMDSSVYDIPFSPIIFENIFGINEMQDKDIQVYPNPTSDYLFLSTISNIKCLEIFDMKGNIVLRIEDLTEPKISIEQLEKGIYFIQLSRENNNPYRSIILKN